MNAPATFADRLSALVAKEMADASGDTERQGEILERLLHSAAFTIALISGGNAKTSGTLAEGSSAYLIETAAGLAPFGSMMREGRVAP